MAHFNDEHINLLIVDFLSGEIDTEGLMELEKWIVADIDNRDHFMRMREIWHLTRKDTSASLGGFDCDAAFESFRARCAASPGRTRLRTVKTILGYAAAVAIGFGGGALLLSRGTSLPQQPVGYTEFIAPQGSQSCVNLPDGSYVMLNGGSTLRYPADYGQGARSVALSGEGYFSVAHDTGAHFLVDIGGATVKVYGTTFTISSYPEDSIATVSLISGHLGMKSRTDSIEHHITSGQSLTLDRADGRISETGFTDGNTDWTRGVLSYERYPLSRLVRSLERSYGTTIVIADPALSSLKVSGKFFRETQSLDDILESLAATGRMQFRRTANGITIYSD
ncbi:FecR domain-containing protein [uncultured Muribaculum sp.]|uniref:FecR family protein n=1 Tax=uncultured Muribaculum sp. TaxID=1918613 RepID=UPI0025EFAE0F|nr:FecR domain-containing protein [uncultured Muribaculum sp.]